MSGAIVRSEYLRRLLPVRGLREVLLVSGRWGMGRAWAYHDPRCWADRVIEVNWDTEGWCPVRLFVVGLHEAGHLVNGHYRAEEGAAGDYQESRAWEWARRELQRHARKGRAYEVQRATFDVCFACTLADCSECQQGDVGLVTEALGLSPALAGLAQVLQEMAAAGPLRRDEGRAVEWRRRVAGARTGSVDRPLM